jgi:multidrug efflux pump subunit AcrB
MSIAELFIKRPVMTTLVMLGILLFGILGYQYLPVSDLPNVDFPTIQVTAGLPGASPETMASSVATPLERQFSTIAGLDNMVSSSALGITQITLQFALDRSLDGAANDVQAAIITAQRQLPPNMPTPPSYQKVNPADQPVIFLSLNSPTLPLSQVNEYGDTLIAHRQRRGPGDHLRPAEIRRPRAARPQRAGHARHRHRRGAEGRRRCQREPPHGHPLRHAPCLHRAGQRPAPRSRAL